MGQPTNADRWTRIEAEKMALLEERAVQIHPGEVLSLRDDDMINLMLIDVRPEANYNVFHLMDAVNIPLDQILAAAPDMISQPANTVFVLMSNDEQAATDAWKLLQAESVVNVYILEGGINTWITTFAESDEGIRELPGPMAADAPHFRFSAAYGQNHPAAYPEAKHFELEFTPKVKLEMKRGPSSGGCG
jgi:rhodanese-related sulfurtransferase